MVLRGAKQAAHLILLQRGDVFTIFIKFLLELFTKLFSVIEPKFMTFDSTLQRLDIPIASFKLFLERVDLSRPASDFSPYHLSMPRNWCSEHFIWCHGVPLYVRKSEA